MARGTGPLSLTRDDAASCRKFILSAHNPYAAGAVAAPDTPSATTESAGGDVGGYDHESERSLLSFYESEMSHHMRYVNTKRWEAMEELLALLFDKVNSGFSKPDMARIFIALGGQRRRSSGSSRSARGGFHFVLYRFPYRCRRHERNKQ